MIQSLALIVRLSQFKIYSDIPAWKNCTISWYLNSKFQGVVVSTNSNTTLKKVAPFVMESDFAIFVAIQARNVGTQTT